MDPVRLTELVVVTNVVLLVVYNLIMGFTVGEHATISYIVAGWCRANPILACAIGVLVGHWLWSIPLQLLKK